MLCKSGIRLWDGNCSRLTRQNLACSLFHKIVSDPVWVFSLFICARYVDTIFVVQNVTA